MKKLDLNCDMGESYGLYSLEPDEQIFEIVTSINIACGFHAGDPSVMRRMVQKAHAKGIAIGAHPGLPDRLGFGRRKMEVTAEQVYDMVVYQMGALAAFAKAEGTFIQHVKPHGALYHMAAESREIANAIAEAVQQVNSDWILYGLSGSALIEAGEAIGLQTANEVFADRTYQADGTLTPRREPNAMISDPQSSLLQILHMVNQGTVLTQQGCEVPIHVDTVCIHGDTPQAIQLAQYLDEHLRREGVSIQSLRS